MMRSLVLLTAAAVLTAGPALAAPRLFPKTVYDAGGGDARFIERLEPRPLWRGRVSAGRQRVRMMVGGITINSWSVELDRRESGRVVGILRQHNGRYLSEETSFAVRATDFAALEGLIAEAGLWRIDPQFYVETGSDEICLDGLTVVFERVDASGYRYAEGNAQCTLGRAQLRVVAKIFELANRPGLASFAGCCLDEPPVP